MRHQVTRLFPELQDATCHAWLRTALTRGAHINPSQYWLEEKNMDEQKHDTDDLTAIRAGRAINSSTETLTFPHGRVRN